MLGGNGSRPDAEFTIEKLSNPAASNLKLAFWQLIWSFSISENPMIYTMSSLNSDELVIIGPEVIIFDTRTNDHITVDHFSDMKFTIQGK